MSLAHDGLCVDGSTRADLAEWLPDRASDRDNREIALEAAIALFEGEPSLPA